MAARANAVAATEERLLAAAWEHFSTRPYEEVRLADIAADAGVTVQTLHDVRQAVRLLYDSYEAQGDAVFRMLAAEERIPAVHDMAEAGRAWHRAWVERTFAPLLDGVSGAARERRLVQLVVATDALVWKLLRREMGLGRAAAERVVIEMITALKGAS
jgi:AcrR family transcriptional regulator